MTRPQPLLPDHYRLKITIGDGFRFGIGFTIAQVFLAIAVFLGLVALLRLIPELAQHLSTTPR